MTHSFPTRLSSDLAGRAQHQRCAERAGTTADDDEIVGFAHGFLFLLEPKPRCTLPFTPSAARAGCGVSRGRAQKSLDAFRLVPKHSGDRKSTRLNSSH